MIFLVLRKEWPGIFFLYDLTCIEGDPREEFSFLPGKTPVFFQSFMLHSPG